jgi:hypothetical protein
MCEVTVTYSTQQHISLGTRQRLRYSLLLYPAELPPGLPGQAGFEPATHSSNEVAETYSIQDVNSAAPEGQIAVPGFSPNVEVTGASSTSGKRGDVSAVPVPASSPLAGWGLRPKERWKPTG